jgi:predicted RNA binding protein YcfA (HicA-like mRNA interferase family)
VPKLPRVSGAQIVRALERLGFTIARRRGSHIVMRRGANGCVVPDHRDVKLGTLVGILKQAGVSADEFETAHRS